MMVCRSFSGRVAFQGHHISVFQMDFLTSSGKMGTWEYVGRTSPLRNFDIVLTLATIMHLGRRHLIAISKFRPHLQKHVIELPASFVKTDESAANISLKHLFKTTGYTAKLQDVHEVGPIVHMDAWKSIETSRTVQVRVPAEGNPAQPRKNVLLLPFEGISEVLERVMKEKELAVDSKLYFFAEGTRFAGR